MSDTLVSAGSPVTSREGRPWVSRVGDIVRDIARGGIAGVIVGLLVAGLGGRLVMRAVTILHEDTVGIRTENGELIGVISVSGTVALLLFGGLAMGLLAGTIWVIVSPWIPGRGLPRALLTAGAATALGIPPVIQRSNHDFRIVGYDPNVVLLFVGLVGLVGFSIAVLDGFLDARLPRPPGGVGISTAAYVIIALTGLVLILPLMVSFLLVQPEYESPIRAGWGLAVVGACTLMWWILRVRGRSAPPRALRLAGTASLLVTVVLGAVTSLPHVLASAGLS